jgi:hypothetical protein
MFRTLFLGGDRSEAVSPAVQQLWGGGTGASSTSTSATPASAASSTTMTSSTAPSTTMSYTPVVRAPQPLDLFSDRAGTFAS